jgi:hypothetical protein
VLRAGVTLLVRLVADRAVRRTGRRSAMIGSILAAAVAMALLPLAGVGGAPALMVLLGIGLGWPIR